MKIYHEVSVKSFESVQRDGLKRSDRGAKGQDNAIIKTDTFLDEHRPDSLRNEGVTRSDNLYGYLGKGDSIIDIKDGSLQTVTQRKRKGAQVLLCLRVDSTRCWVSDLDLYDAVLTHINQQGKSDDGIRLAEQYWQSLIRLELYEWGSIKRPEVMITYDIDPLHITKV